MTFMQRVLSNGGGILIFLATGWGLIQLLPALRRKGILPRTGYAYLLGIASLSSGSWALSYFARVPLKRSLFLWLAFAFVAAGVCRLLVNHFQSQGTGSRDQRGFSPHRAALATLPALVAAALTVGIFAQGLTEVTRDFDGQMTWIPAARFIRAAGNVSPAVLTEEKWFVTHPRYPLLLPLAQVTVLEVFDAPNDDRAFLCIYAFFFPAYLAILWDACRSRSSLLASAGTLLMASLIPLFVFEGSGGAGGTYSDFPLACFWGSAVLLLAESPLTQSRAAASGILLAAAALTKNEGGPLALAALTAIAAATAWRAIGSFRMGWRQALRNTLAMGTATLVLGLGLALFFSWRHAIPNRYDEGYENVRSVTQVVKATWKRLPLLPAPMWQEMRYQPHWNAFWIVAPIMAFSGISGLRRRPARPLILALAAGVSVFFVAYGITPWSGAELVHPTWNRFLMQLSLPGFVLLSMCLGASFRNLRPLAAVVRFPRPAGPSP